MINKKVLNVTSALDGIKDNMTIMLGGLGYVEFLKNQLTN